MMVDRERGLIVKSSGVCLLWLVIIVCGNKGSEIRALTSNNNNNNGNNHHGNPNINGHPHIQSHGNVTVLAGQRGELKCQATSLANYSVMWLRHRDTHLLSIGTDAYIVDTRFRAFKGADNIWGLRISSTRPSDGGVYECQISTTPPISAFTYLTVVEPVTRIEGLSGRNSELFIKAGSTINLTCIVEDATDQAPKHILWKHNSRTVNFEWSRGGMSLVTEKKTKGVTVSRLLIQKAVRSDSGTYMCAPQNAHPAYAKIHVLEQGEKQAAMQSGSGSWKISRGWLWKGFWEDKFVLLQLFILPNQFANLIIAAVILLLNKHLFSCPQHHSTPSPQSFTMPTKTQEKLKSLCPP